jgi:hypothetical protein
VQPVELFVGMMQYRVASVIVNVLTETVKLVAVAGIVKADTVGAFVP